MATYQCPKGHASTDPDYCSECGALIGAPTISAAVVAPTAAATGLDVCPDCQTPRTPGARYCEVCRFDFEAASTPTAAPTAAPSPADTVVIPQVIVPAAAPPAAPPVAPQALAPDSSPIVPVRLNVIILADPTIPDDEAIRQQCPKDEPPLTFPLDLDENLVGRRSENKKIFPEIDISDPGVSHRHLKFLRQPDGTFAALELGSSNGTALNGTPLKPGLLTPVKAGDEMILGLWTRLQLRSRA